MNVLPLGALGPALALTLGLLGSLFVIGLIVMLIRMYRKVEQGRAFIRNGFGGTRVSFTGILSFPVFHNLEEMDISVKRVEIDRRGKDGLICKDNMRADINVAFFVRVNKTPEDVKNVAQSIGCLRASSLDEIESLFDAKFSEALKTVGKHFEFEELYTNREKFKDEILKVIGTDLNGFILDDAAIDYLEQTPLEFLNADNILDSEGIKKITDRTAQQKVLANQIDQDRIKTITKQNVEAKEAVLELEKQQAEAEEKQKREISVIRSREEAEAARVAEEQRLRAEQARIATEEEIAIATENKERQVIVAAKNKARTDAVESERVERDRQLEIVERNKVTELADIEKEKAVEIQKRDIQDVIKERVMVEKTVVQEQEKIKDTEAFAEADRSKKVAITAAEMKAQEALVEQLKAAEASKEAEQLKAEEAYYKEVKAAEAGKRAAELKAEELVVEAEAEETASERKAAAKKNIAEAITAEAAAQGLGEAQVLEANADASRKQGEADATVAQLKFAAEAQGITEKAEAMKIFDGVGREHEEFKLRLEKEKDIELAEIEVNEKIAEYQSVVLGEALKNTKVDIVGGNTDFYDKIIGAVTRGKSFDRMLDNSAALTDVKETFFNGDPDYFKGQIQKWISQFGISSEDLKNLSIAALLGKMSTQSQDKKETQEINSLIALAEKFGVAGESAVKFLTDIKQ